MPDLKRRTKHVRVRNEYGETIASEFVSVGPGESETVSQQGHVTDSRFDPDITPSP